jgi:signal transduction histidine kinase
MRFFVVLLFLCISLAIKANDTCVTLKSSMYEDVKELYLTNKDGWLFKKGNDSSYINGQGWQPLKPVQLSAKMADNNGRLEGWFRFRFKVDTSISNQPHYFYLGRNASFEVFLDGQKIAQVGNVNGVNRLEVESFEFERIPFYVKLISDKEYLLSIHMVDYVIPAKPLLTFKKDSLVLMSEVGELKNLFELNSVDFLKFHTENLSFMKKFLMAIMTVCIILALLFVLLFFFNTKEQQLLLFASLCLLVAFSILGATPYLLFVASPLDLQVLFSYLADFCFIAILVLMPVIIANIYHYSLSKYQYFLLLILIVWDVYIHYDTADKSIVLIPTISFLLLLWIIIGTPKRFEGPNKVVMMGLLFTVLAQTSFGIVPNEWFNGYHKYKLATLVSIYTLSFPVSLLIYTAMRFKQMIHEVEARAAEVIKLSEEKKEQALRQKEILQEEVNTQTAELRTTLANLQATQTQLIQAEKMASLGELTAGIAHEIQNPLNFINNFSEVNQDLLAELKTAVEKGDWDEVKLLAADVQANEDKITHHGKRADAIVKGMLQHSRHSTGQKEATDINALCDEYLRLAYHGLRASDKGFNAQLSTSLDPAVGVVDIMVQELGRVVLNLINNAFYAVHERKQKEGADFIPQVTITTQRVDDQIMIKVADNGGGIPAAVREKIFQPFFTTKPTGKGTGLGLSLSYDIITKGHQGKIELETKEGVGTTFTIILPVK